jgi:thiol-disulfide isomerase/thioredoxin
MWIVTLLRTWARFGLCVALLSFAACEEAPPRKPLRDRAPAASEQLAEPAAGSDLKPIDAAALFEHMRSGKEKKRGTVVNVWASWCGSCKGEVPMLLKLREALASSGLDFVFVSADEPRDFPKAVELLRGWSGPMPAYAVAGAMGPFKQAMHPEWKGAIPATFLFDEQQKRRYFWEGPIREHEIAPILQGYLAGETIDGELRPPLVGGQQ